MSIGWASVRISGMDLQPIKWNKFILLDHIGSGGMAEVYLAIPADESKGKRLLVVKRIHSNFGASSEMVKMFKIERQALLALDSPYIVRTYDTSGDADPEPYLAMEYIEGPSIKQAREFLSVRGTSVFPTDIALEIVRHIFAGLKTAHEGYSHISGGERVILHRDISPHNLILSTDGHLKIIDFGVAKFEAYDSATLFAGQIKGKLNYMSPEQFLADEKLDARSDIFSVGIVLWELLSGSKFFPVSDNPNEFAIERFIKGMLVQPELTHLNPSVDQELSDFVKKLTALNREERYSSASEAEKWINSYQKSRGYESGPELLKRFIADNFNEHVEHDRRRIKLLLEKAKNANEYMTEVQTVASFSLQPSNKIKYALSFLSLTLILAGLIYIKFFSTENTSAQVELKPRAISSTKEVISLAKELSREELDMLKTFFQWTMRIRSEESEDVVSAWQSTAKLRIKRMNSDHYLQAFLDIPADDRKQILEDLLKFKALFDSEEEDSKKIELINRYKKQIESLPPPRQRSDSSKNSNPD